MRRVYLNKNTNKGEPSVKNPLIHQTSKNVLIIDMCLPVTLPAICLDLVQPLRNVEIF